MDTTTIIGLVVSGATAIGGGVTAVWKWITKQLDECKEEHAKARERIECLHEDIKNVSSTVGELKGQLAVCVRYLPPQGKLEAKDQHDIDISHD